MKKVILLIVTVFICYVNFGQNKVELSNIEKIAKK